jgi:hypothetical protein
MILNSILMNTCNSCPIDDGLGRLADRIDVIRYQMPVAMDNPK